MKSTGFNLKSEKDPLAYRSGPPKSFGGYDKWNWCKRCKHIHTKDIRYCPDCKGIQLRTTSKAKFGNGGNSRNLTHKEKREKAIAVQADLVEWQREQHWKDVQDAIYIAKRQGKLEMVPCC